MIQLGAFVLFLRRDGNFMFLIVASIKIPLNNKEID